MFKRLFALCVAMLAACVSLFISSSLWADSPRLGVPMTHKAAEAFSYTVLPGGAGLPVGRGDAVAGAKVYSTHCLACHGQRGVGGINDQLAGGLGSLSSDEPIKTIGSYWPYATTVFDFVRRAMPYQTPGVLSDDEVYAVTAYLLYINGIVAEQFVIDENTLPDVAMPNADNFSTSFE